MSTTETELAININDLPSKSYASLFDRKIPKRTTTFGTNPSSEAIGGYYGIGWHEVYRNYETGELYTVYCSDGVHGGKSAFSGEDEAKRQNWFYEIRERTMREVDEGAAEIILSPREWGIISTHTFYGWLDEEDKADRAIDTGQIGHIKGIPVVVDKKFEDELE